MKACSTIKNKIRQGFSLIETMVAILVLTFLVLGGAAVLYRTGGSIQMQGNRYVAVELVNELLEVAQNTDYLNLVDSQTTRTINGITYTLYTDVTTIPNPSENALEMRDVVVRVVYRGDEISVNSVVIHGLGIEEFIP